MKILTSTTLVICSVYLVSASVQPVSVEPLGQKIRLQRIMAIGERRDFCSDGVKGIFEQCDDGNLYSSDGCSVDCLLENENQFLCVENDDGKTECCVLLVNPVTQEAVCDCASIEQPRSASGFTITPACLKRDIDECNTDNGGCLPNAICTNFNVVVDPTQSTHKCSCFPGSIGDGVDTCTDSSDYAL
jgi:cysteine-rich repeat protein